jgi:hypothetical protein
MEKDAVEKELQKNNFLQIQILRDKITSLSRKQNLLSQRYGGMLNRQPANNAALEATEKQLDELEAQIGDLEVDLTLLQDAEVQRRSRAIANRQGEAVLPSSSSSAVLIDSPSMYTARDSMSPLTTATNTVGGKEDRQPTQAADLTGEPPETVDISKLLCVECEKIPSNHCCRKCKQRVCTVCCTTKRHLEMVWWCKTCFANESNESQAIIRAGDYVSDNDCMEPE